MNYLTNYYKNLSEQLQERLNYLQKLLNESDMNRKNPLISYADDPELQIFSDEPDPKTRLSDREMAGFDKRTDAEAAQDLEDIKRDNEKYPYKDHFSPHPEDYYARINEQMPVDIHGRPIYYTYGEADPKQREQEKAKQDKIKEEERKRQPPVWEPPRWV